MERINCERPVRCAGGSGRASRASLEGVLSKYTNMLQGWQNRYFVLDAEQSQLLYFVSEQGKNQKPRGFLALLGASVDVSDEAPYMFTVHSAGGEVYKLRASDAGEQQFWIDQLQASARCLPDSVSKTAKLKNSHVDLLVEKTSSGQNGLGCSPTSSGQTGSASYQLPDSPTPSLQRRQSHPGIVVMVTHHKSPAAARRTGRQYPCRLQEVKEVMTQVESQQRTLIHSIESLPAQGPVSCLDQDLLLLKATSTATLGCLGECLSILQRNVPPDPTQALPAHQTTWLPPEPSKGLSECLAWKDLQTQQLSS